MTLVSVALILLLGACTSAPPVSKEAPQRVVVRQPNRFEHPLTLNASGNVEAAETAYLSFQVPGQVRKVFVEEGQAVRAGQVLAELDVRDYESRVSAAASQTGVASASLQKADAGLRKQELAQARIDLDRVEDEYNRLKALHDRGSLAPNDYKKIEAAYLAARERYSMAREGARKEDRIAARSAFQGAEAQETIAKKALADTFLTSPFSGIIAKRDVEKGMLVGSSRPVFVLLSLQPAKIRVGVPEAEIGMVRIGQRAEIQIPSLGSRSFAGRVETIGFAADPAARTFSVKISVPNPQLELRAGMVAESRIETRAKVAAMTVPGQAIVRDAQGATTVFLFYAEKNRVYARRVDLGSVFGREVEIVRGLSGAEQVVIGGQQLIHDGMPATPVQAGVAE